MNKKIWIISPLVVAGLSSISIIACSPKRVNDSSIKISDKELKDSQTDVPKVKQETEKTQPIDSTPNNKPNESKTKDNQQNNTETKNTKNPASKIKEDNSKQKQDPVLKKVLDTWDKDFKNDIWEKWTYKEIFERLKSKFPKNNLQLVSDPETKPKPNSNSTNPPFVIKLNDSSNEHKLPFGKVWPIYQNTDYKDNEAITIGYDNEGKIKKFMPTTNKVPQHLPKFINSLHSAFENSTQEIIENLDKWDTSNINNFNGVFNNAIEFNHDISGWKTDSAESMYNMFAGAKKFNQNISDWNTSNVNNMDGMFWDAKNFDQNLNSWNVEKVTSMDQMFSGTRKFNSNLDKWKPRSVKNVYGMFAHSIFNKSLKSWESYLPNKLTNAAEFNKNNTNLVADKLPRQILEFLSR